MSHQRVAEIFSKAWADSIAAGPPAKGVEDVRTVDFHEFFDRVSGGDEEHIRAFVRSAYAGNVYIFANAYDPAKVRALKDAAYAWKKTQPSQEPLLVDDVTDYRSRRDWHAEEKGGYSSTYDMLHFYRWNGDPLGAFAMLAKQYELLRLISGFVPETLLSKKPSDGIVDRIEISHYPRGLGGIAFHSDPLMAQKFQLTLTINEYGKDFMRGGFAVGSKDGKTIVPIEPLAPLGSIYGFLPSVCHGVQVIDPDQPADWEGSGGRWYAATSMVTSSTVEKREITLPVAGFPTLREQIAQHRATA